MSVKVTGTRQTQAALRDVAKYAVTPANEAARASLRPTLAAARKNAPFLTRLLKRSLRVKMRGKKGKSRLQYRVGPDATAKGPNGEKAIKYAHITEFGRAPNKNGKGGIRGLRWLTRAYEQTREGVSKAFGEQIGPAIEKYAAKRAAKARR